MAGNHEHHEDATLDRRSFLTIAAAGAATSLVGCGDDAIESSSGTGLASSSGTTTTGSLSGMGESSGDGDGASSASGRGTTTGAEIGDESSGGDEGGGLVDLESLPIDEVAFPLAIMAGEMKPTSFMVASLIEDMQPKLLRVWPDSEGAEIDVVAEIAVEPGTNGYTKVAVRGLEPGQWYRYALFSEDGATRSLIGRVRTAIAEDALEPLTIALTACNGDSFEWPALERQLQYDYDIFMHLGDMAYNDGARTLEEFRLSWRDYIGHETFKRVLANTGMYHTWDDHEIDDNSNFDPETMEPDELLKRQNAMDAFFELLPIDAEGPDYRLWRSFRWGLTAEIILLDCRYERRPSNEIYISVEQMLWLKQRLAESPCQFKVIMNSVPITDMPLVWEIANGDRWEGFPAQRNELLDYIDEQQIDNVWFLSGDFHVCFVSRINSDGERAVDRIREVAVTGGNTNPLFDVPVAGELIAALNPPQFDLGNSIPSTVLVRFDPEADTMNVRFIAGETGEMLHNATYTYGE